MLYFFRFLPFIILLSPIILSSSLPASEGKGAALHDLGVFSYESGNYESAEKQIRKALEEDPGSPYYLHSLGRVLYATGRYGEARNSFQKAMAQNPEITGLKFDLATAEFKLQEYEKAAELFIEVADKNPENALASYQAGMSLYRGKHYSRATKHLNLAAQSSPSLRPHSHFVVGLCHFKAENLDDARDMFTKVVDDPEAGELKEKAIRWVHTIREKKKALKPWSLYAKLGRRYDDNVRLDPIDKDIEGDASDGVTIVNFRGAYRILKMGQFSAGAAYVHYESMHDDLGQFDLRGSMLKVYSQYKANPFIFRVTLAPSYYWLDSESYQRSYELLPEAFWKISPGLATHLALRFSDDTNFKEDGDSGDLSGFFADARIKAPIINGHIFGGFGWESFDANSENESWETWKAKAGAMAKLPMDLHMAAIAEASKREYDAEEGCCCEKRDDEKFVGSLSLSRHIYYQWLRLMGEYSFIKRDSNYVNKRYERNKIMVSLSAQF